MTTAKQSDLESFSNLGGVPVQPTPRYLTSTMLATLNCAFEELWQVCPWGKAYKIVHMGATVDRPDPEGVDRHAQGRAIDIGSIYWGAPTTQTVWATDPHFLESGAKNTEQMRHYLGVTAVFEKHLGCVLSYWQPDGKHRSHWHLDDHRQPGWSKGWKPSVRFLQAALKYVWGEDIGPTGIDGDYGAKTQAAWARVIGPPPGTFSADLGSTWVVFLDATINKAFGS